MLFQPNLLVIILIIQIKVPLLNYIYTYWCLIFLNLHHFFFFFVIYKNVFLCVVIYDQLYKVYGK